MVSNTHGEIPLELGLTSETMSMCVWFTVSVPTFAEHGLTGIASPSVSSVSSLSSATLSLELMTLLKTGGRPQSGCNASHQLNSKVPSSTGRLESSELEDSHWSRAFPGVERSPPGPDRSQFRDRFRWSNKLSLTLQFSP